MRKIRLMLVMIAFNILVLSSQVLALEPTKVEDTFSYNNIKNTISNTSTTSIDNFIYIAKDNTVWQRNSGNETEIYKGILGTSMTDVVKVASYEPGISGYALDSNGYVWQYAKDTNLDGTVSKGKFYKLDFGEHKIVDIVIIDNYNTSIIVLTTNNKLVYMGNRNANYKVLDSIDILDINKIYTSFNQSRYIVATTESKKAYLIDINNLDLITYKICAENNVKEAGIVYDNRNGASVILDLNGNVYIGSVKYNIDEYVNSIICNGSNVFAVTDTGTYKLGVSINPTKFDEKVDMVAFNGSYIIDTDSRYRRLEASRLTLSEPLDIKPWHNTNPIIPNYYLGNVEVERNTIIDKNESYNIKFNLVSSKLPKHFNIYYAKQENVSTREKWVLIENIETSRLEQEKYNNTYNTDNGIKYNYTWQLPKDTNLTSIQIIIEPVYEVVQ